MFLMWIASLMLYMWIGVIFTVKNLMAVGHYNIGSNISVLYSPKHCHGSFFAVGSEGSSCGQYIPSHPWGFTICSLFISKLLSLAQAYSIFYVCCILSLFFTLIIMLSAYNKICLLMRNGMKYPRVISTHVKYGRCRLCILLTVCSNVI